ncbi:MAG: hypothetical protein Q4G30_06815 [Actinomycetaceae bacterium]|nr:hypothetical protein [Actinomycetaceae bacterium]
MNETTVSRSRLLKFSAVALVGLGAFTVPFPYQGSVTIAVGAITDVLTYISQGAIDFVLIFLTSISTIGSVLATILKQLNKLNPESQFQKLFYTTPIYLVTKLIAFALLVAYYSNFTTDVLPLSEPTTQMISLAKTLIALAVSLSFLLPFLTEGGLMEFIGELTKPFVQPLFKVPSHASLDLIASWLGASSAAVILSAEKYREGYYSKREVANVMCNFSLVSIPFCLVVAKAARVDQYFSIMYLLLCVLGVILAIIAPRIYPLNRIEDTFIGTRTKLIPPSSDKHILARALDLGCQQVQHFTWRLLLRSGTQVCLGICLNLVPIVIAWGVAGLLVVQHTPLLNWIAFPMGLLLEVMGVQSAASVAPATLAGFVDMFIPALLIGDVEPTATRFIIATLSLIQIIYITEVGVIIIKTDVGLNFWKLFIIFIERTLISLPLIVLVAKLIF